MIKINDELHKSIENYLNHRLGPGEHYITLDKYNIISDVRDKIKVYVEYSVEVSVPVYTDPETGIIEYDNDIEYRSDELVIPKSEL